MSAQLEMTEPTTRGTSVNSPGQPAIVVTDLRKSFGATRVLDGIDLTVGRGTVFALLGANGSGKTTTINILTTLINADGGTASVAGFDVAEQPSEVREQISVTGQFAAVDHLLTARENLVLMGELRHIADPRQTAADLLDTFDLNEAADRRLLTFSGGMRRRLDIAMSLVGDAPIIFFDEPTTGLDPKGRTDMYLTIRQLVENGTTVFLTTQYLEEADRLADEIAILHRGRIVAGGTPDELKTMVPTGLVELEFGNEEQLLAAQRALGEQHDGHPRRLEAGRRHHRIGGRDGGHLHPPQGRAGSNRPGSPGNCRRWTTCSSRSSMTTGRTGMRTLTDTWTMTKRSLRHTTRSIDTIITVVMMPIALLLLFVYVFGDALGKQTGSIDYVDFITPGVVIMTVTTGIAYAAVRLSTDLQKGIIGRFRTMPVAPSAILSGQAVSSTLSSLLSCFLVVMVAFVVGFGSNADIAAWLGFVGLLVLFTLATTWLAMVFGLLAKTVEGAGAFSYILLLLIFISPSFVPTDSMTPALRTFAENQPMTPIVETMRSLLTHGTAGPDLWGALAWAAGILIVSYTIALGIYRRSAPLPVAP